MCRTCGTTGTTTDHMLYRGAAHAVPFFCPEIQQKFSFVELSEIKKTLEREVLKILKRGILRNPCIRCNRMDTGIPYG